MATNTGTPLAGINSGQYEYWNNQAPTSTQIALSRQGVFPGGIPPPGGPTSVQAPPDYASLAKQYGITNYTGTSAQKAAINSYLYGYPVGQTNPSTISGSSSVSQNIQKNSAISSATSSITPAQPAPVASPASTSAPAPVGNPGTPLNSASTALTTSTFDPGSYEAGLQTQMNNETALASKTANDQIQGLTTSFNTNYSAMQDQRAKAVAGASAEYDATHPYSRGTDKAQYMESVSKYYDTQLENMQNDFNTQKESIQDALSGNILNIQGSYASSLASYQQQQFANNISLEKLGISESDLQIAMDKLGISQAQLGIAQQKLGLSTDQLIYTIVKAANPDVETKTNPFKFLGITFGKTKTTTTPSDAEQAALQGLLSGLTGGSFTGGSSGSSDSSSSAAPTAQSDDYVNSFLNQ